MTRAIVLALGILTLGAASPARSDADSTTARVIAFEDADPGKVPSGFSTALTGGGGPVSWRIEEDPTAPSGPRVLVQTSADKTSARFPLCIYDPVSTADVALSVEFKPVSGTIDQAAGLVWRYQNPANYYLVRANALEGNVVLYKVEAGKRTDLKPVGAGFFAYGTKVAVPPGQWSTLRVEAKGKRFSVSLGGQHLFDVDDETFPGPGKVGLWTKADSVTAFDRLTIEPLDGRSQ